MSAFEHINFSRLNFVVSNIILILQLRGLVSGQDIRSYIDDIFEAVGGDPYHHFNVHPLAEDLLETQIILCESFKTSRIQGLH